MAATASDSKILEIAKDISNTLTLDSTDEEVNVQSNLCGTILSEEIKFTNKHGDTLRVTPLIIDFRRTFQLQPDTDVVPNVSCRELLHSVVGLYDVCLSDMTPDVLYSTVCAKWAKTIVLVQSTDETLKTRAAQQKANGPVKEMSEDFYKAVDLGDDVYDAKPDSGSTFRAVYSDTSSSSDEEEDEEDEIFSAGINKFINSAIKRRVERKKNGDCPSSVGIENRIVGAITFDKKYCGKPGEKVLHITVVAVRPRCRSSGIGHYLLQQVKDTSVVGPFEAVVVHADNSAVDFFTKYGFTADPMVNQKWSELAEQFTNCTLMTYMPPFSNQYLLSKTVPELDMQAMEKEINKWYAEGLLQNTWRTRSLEMYQAQSTCVSRMKNEILYLRALVTNQEEMIKSLMRECESAKFQKFKTEKELLQLKLSIAIGSAGIISDDEVSDDLEESTEELVKRLKDKSYIAPDTGSTEPYDHGKDAELFYKISHDVRNSWNEDPRATHKCTVTMVTKATISQSYIGKFNEQKQRQRQSNTTYLYYSGAGERPARVNEILQNGFSRDDFVTKEKVKGLYFTRYPVNAAQTAPPGMLLVAEVALGTTLTLNSLSDFSDQQGHDSLQWSSSASAGASCGEAVAMEMCTADEFVVFNPDLALPICLVSYKLD